jgi:hypothetical protein
MKNIPSYDEFLNEIIKAEEASRDENAVQTVIDGKRDLGFITLIGTTMDVNEFWELIRKHGLKTLEVPENVHKAYIYYRKGAERKAKELKDIALKYGGYLAYDATEKDSRRIGELLGYDKKDIDWYINKNYK